MRYDGQISYQTVLSLGGTAPAENSEKIYELKVHSHFKEVGEDSTEGIAGSSAVEIPKRKEFWEDLFIAQKVMKLFEFYTYMCIFC